MTYARTCTVAQVRGIALLDRLIQVQVGAQVHTVSFAATRAFAANSSAAHGVSSVVEFVDRSPPQKYQHDLCQIGEQTRVASRLLAMIGA